ncbi:MAG: hypothetical protein LUD22_03065 [Coprobacillus sp.]|nr:hypothetical protein [Coprobacillus sp.]
MIESILSVLLTIVATTSITNNITNQSEETYCDFSSKKAIISERYLSDLDDNKYKLYELEDGYAIYLVDNEDETFLEGSYEINSPFFGYENNEAYYLGPGNYYVKESNKLTNILSTPLAKYKERRNNTIETYVITHEDWGYSDEDELDGYTLIENYQYFKNLEYFPTNYLGTCGLVALCILLGYYDTFYNDNFVNNEMAYQARTYEKITDTQTEEILLNTEEDIPFMKTVMIDYSSTCANNGEYPINKWTSYPGTTQALHDYLFDKCFEYNEGFKDIFGGYPMLPYDVAKTFESYVEKQCASLQDDINIKYGSYLTLAATKTIIRNQIRKNNPLAVTLISYSTEEESETLWLPHTAVAYGFDLENKNFVVNMGLSEYLGGATILDFSFIYGYCYLNYSGEHVHSKNAICTSGSSRALTKNITYDVCGCGYMSLNDNLSSKIFSESGGQ